MILQVCSIYDIKAEAFLPPFFLPKWEMAIRTFKDCVNSEEHQFGQHPEDYILTHVGTFDDETALLLNTEPTDKNCKDAISGVSLVELQPQRENENVKIRDESSVQSSS